MASILKFLAWHLLEIIVLFFIIVFLPGLPPAMKFTEYSVEPVMPFEGALSLNGELNDAEHIFENEVHGPEAFAVYNGEIYTGVHGGHVIKISDGKLVPVAKFGKPCSGEWEEEICGRPLGLKFGNNGNLYVADAYYGVFKVHVPSGKVTQLVSMDVPIEGRKPMIANSVAISKSGVLYWTSSSSDVGIADGVYTLLGDGTGRLFRYDPATNESTVLMDNLHFANGVVLSPNEDFILVAETVRSRIHRYYLKGPRKDTHDIFISGLPGFPDNLIEDGEGGYYTPLVFASDNSKPALTHVLGPYPIARKFLARLLALMELPFQLFDRYFPNEFVHKIHHWLGSFPSIKGLGSPRTSVLHLDADGKVDSSMHCMDKSLNGISDVLFHQGYMYFGSPYNRYIGRKKIVPTRIPIHIKTKKE